MSFTPALPVKLDIRYFVLSVTTIIYKEMYFFMPNFDNNFSLDAYGNLDSTKALRHTAAHILAQAVNRIFGHNVKLSIGPAIGTGFYYDFDTNHRFCDERCSPFYNV